MPFHRYVDPSYNLLGGSFPGTIGGQTYDRLNVVSGGVGGGDGSSNADGAKVGGPNAGTYMVAFGEDATSSFANRGLRALGQNTDFLDNMVRGSVPGYDIKQIVLAAPASTYTMSQTGVFVGDSASENPGDIIVLVNSSGEQVYTSTGSPIYVTGIDAGAAPSIVGNGFVDNPRLSFSGSVPAGTYYIVYGGRTSMARAIETPDRDSLWTFIGRAFRRAVFGASFTHHGLDERYRRAGFIDSTLDSSSGANNVAGSGSVITRDGRGLTLVMETRNWEAVASALDDPIRAGFISSPLKDWWLGTETFTDFDAAYSGNLGHVHITRRRFGGSGSERGPRGRDMGAFATLNPVDLAAPSYGSDDYNTYLSAQTPATLNPAGAGGDRVQIAAPYYFRNGAYTGIALRYDLLLITRNEGGVTTTKPYLITGLLSDYVVTVMPFGGKSGDTVSFTADTSATIRWVQPTEVVGGVNTYDGYGGPVNGSSWAPLMLIDPNRNLGEQQSDAGYIWTSAKIYGSRPYQNLLTFGAFLNTSGGFSTALFITSSGSIQQQTGYTYGSFRKRPTSVNFSSSTSYNILMTSGYSSVFFSASGSVAKTLTFVDNSTSSSNEDPQPGFEFVFFVENTTAYPITIVGPTGWKFSDGDNLIPAESSKTYQFVVRYTLDTVGSSWRAFVTRTDFNTT